MRASRWSFHSKGLFNASGLAAKEAIKNEYQPMPTAYSIDHQHWFFTVDKPKIDPIGGSPTMEKEIYRQEQMPGSVPESLTGSVPGCDGCRGEEAAGKFNIDGKDQYLCAGCIYYEQLKEQEATQGFQ